MARISVPLWLTRIVQFPNRFTSVPIDANNTDLTPNQGTVTQSGTPFSTSNMQDISDSIQSNADLVDTDGVSIPIFNTVAPDLTDATNKLWLDVVFDQDVPALNFGRPNGIQLGDNFSLGTFLSNGDILVLEAKVDSISTAGRFKGWFTLPFTGAKFIRPHHLTSSSTQQRWLSASIAIQTGVLNFDYQHNHSTRRATGQSALTFIDQNANLLTIAKVYIQKKGE